MNLAGPAVVLEADEVRVFLRDMRSHYRERAEFSPLDFGVYAADALAGSG